MSLLNNTTLGLQPQLDIFQDVGNFLDKIEIFRLDAARKLNPKRRSELGQFFTPLTIARLMASMFQQPKPLIRLLDAGAGVGTLSAAFLSQALKWGSKPKSISIAAYEIDPLLADYLNDTTKALAFVCEQQGIKFSTNVYQQDFIKAGVEFLSKGLFSTQPPTFNFAILNPPYFKIKSDSETRRLLRSVDIETTNLYTAFLSIVICLLEPKGELVAITPRSFCNGPYFKPFRKLLLSKMNIRRIHVFESRKTAFQDDDVLQENVIFHAVKDITLFPKVTITTSNGINDDISVREIDYNQVVKPDDPDYFIHIVQDGLQHQIANQANTFNTMLAEIGIAVSTGRVVDFRAKEYLRSMPEKNTAPLIYPGHFYNGFIKWPNEKISKPNAIAVAPGTNNLTVPAGVYVLVKRFSSKEEQRRVVAAIYDSDLIPSPVVGFENHLNYYHQNGKGLPINLAKGLCIFLNSTLIDSYFRQFNGHTQVNATDLRSLKYPTRQQLEHLGKTVGDTFPNQNEIDNLISTYFFSMTNNETTPDPIQAKKKIDEALSILKDLGFPREQQNERSALTLLALLDLRPDMFWAESKKPLCGITEMMNYFTKHYGKTYAPNTRETVRRQTVHQFLDAGLVLLNPDNPSRPVNSPKAVYQVGEPALALLQTFGTEQWDNNLREYLTSVGTLQQRYARERAMVRIPVKTSSGQSIELSPGGQNILIKQIIEEFCLRYTPNGKLVYIGDADEKRAYFDKKLLGSLGVVFDAHGKMPDVVVYYENKGWLVLIEAVTSHGPVNAKRHDELKKLFEKSKAGLVFVSASPNRRTMVKYLGEISWETEVWVAEAPTHMIDFNGERFLGPYL
ncbi:MAG: Eco57I restriction-modification methylase domain-containing protein [Acidobacteria bacterium]|nr:Eco57I restriction-modification methylase domain-containing protein [Acidobacteriota bacterium]